jgi:hypothetical protein
MSVAYNPFELLDLPALKDMQRKGKYFLVIQRFHWPGLPAKKGFIVSPYQEEKVGRQHAETLDNKEGRLIDLSVEYNIVLSLINHPQYLLFLSSFREPDWQVRLLRYYQKNIESFFADKTQTNFNQNTDIEFCIRYGKLRAMIRTESREDEYDVIEMLCKQPGS